MSPFDGIRDRIERAIAHREALAEIWNNLVEKHLYDVFVDVKDDGTGTICVHPSDDLPASCALELGETLYHLRAALDGSIYQAAIIESGQDPPPHENRLEFPICSRPTEFRDSAWKIQPLSQQCRTFIESIQPYNAPKQLSPELVILNMNRSLWILNDWARKDRHRQLHVVCSWASNASPMVHFPPGVMLKSIRVSGDGFLENHREIASFRLAGYVPGMKVEANPNLMIDVAVNEIPKPAADNDTLGERLKQMVVAVRFVVGALEAIALGKAA
jgi:hypothetical protein